MSGTEDYKNDVRWGMAERMCKMGQFAKANEIVIRIQKDHKVAIIEEKNRDLATRWMEGKTLLR